MVYVTVIICTLFWLYKIDTIDSISHVESISSSSELLSTTTKQIISSSEQLLVSTTTEPIIVLQRPRPRYDVLAVILSRTGEVGLARRQALSKYYSAYEPKIGLLNMTFHYVFVLSNETVPSYYDHYSRTFWVQAKEGYLELTPKMHKLLLDLPAFFDFDFLFKLDDDALICMNRIGNHIMSVPSEKRGRYFGGHLVQNYEPYPFPHMGGPGYIIGPLILKDLRNKHDCLLTIYNELAEDVTVGYWVLSTHPNHYHWKMHHADCKVREDPSGFVWHRCDPDTVMDLVTNNYLGC